MGLGDGGGEAQHLVHPLQCCPAFPPFSRKVAALQAIEIEAAGHLLLFLLNVDGYPSPARQVDDVLMVGEVVKSELRVKSNSPVFKPEDSSEEKFVVCCHFKVLQFLAFLIDINRL